MVAAAVLVVVGLAFLATQLLSSSDDDVSAPPATSNAEHTLTGYYTLIDADVIGPLSSCRGDGGYSDFAPGVDVKVRDKAGVIIGNDSLTNIASAAEVFPGEYNPETRERLVQLNKAADSGILCILKFSVSIPTTDIYEIQIGSGTRGTQTYKFADLDNMGWNVELSLG